MYLESDTSPHWCQLNSVLNWRKPWVWVRFSPSGLAAECGLAKGRSLCTNRIFAAADLCWGGMEGFLSYPRGSNERSALGPGLFPFSSGKCLLLHIFIFKRGSGHRRFGACLYLQPIISWCSQSFWRMNGLLKIPLLHSQSLANLAHLVLLKEAQWLFALPLMFLRSACWGTVGNIPVDIDAPYLGSQRCSTISLALSLRIHYNCKR